MGKRGSVKCVKVHKAVAETYLKNPNNYPVVHHKDENKQNPKIENLEWVTSQQNTRYHLKEVSKTTEFFNNRKLRKEDVDFIRGQGKSMSLKCLADKYGVSKTTISNVRNNRLYAY